jgi:putative ABC transport system ATP-binding protein
MSGLDSPTKGGVFIDSDNLSEIDADSYRREKVAMIFQAFQLLPLFTVLENVCYPMRQNGIGRQQSKERAMECLQSVGIAKDLFKRFPSKLSGGEQQRVAIARSLATGAKVILADEPTGNLDDENTRNVVEILKKLAHEDGYCIIIVTHDMEVAAAADTVYKLNGGLLSSDTPVIVMSKSK